MDKNVLIITSSPRKNGNSDLLAEQFAKGAEESSNNVETVFLRDKRINYCLGCEYCHAHNDVCLQKDDMAEILDKMQKADVIVLASPVYFYTMNAQMKTFIDRCVAKYTQISDKNFYYIVTAADTDKDMLEKTIDSFRGFTDDCLDNPHEKGIIFGIGVWKKGEVKDKPSMKQAYEMGKTV